MLLNFDFESKKHIFHLSLCFLFGGCIRFDSPGSGSNVVDASSSSVRLGFEANGVVCGVERLLLREGWEHPQLLLLLLRWVGLWLLQLRREGAAVVVVVGAAAAGEEQAAVELIHVVGRWIRVPAGVRKHKMSTSLCKM